MGDTDHVREIERVLSGSETGRDSVVAESWRRCVDSYGLDPARRESAHIVTDAQLRHHREQSERLIATARSGLQALFRQVAGQRYVVMLADAKGVCVDYFGDPQFEDDLRAAGLYLGSDWSEDLAGTCAVGSCIVAGHAVTIHQSDHFGLAHTPLSCTAAPIYDSTGALTAVLDISLLRSPGPKPSQNLAMSLVQAAARRVEMANLMATTRRDWVLRFSTSPDFLEVDPDAAVALDGAGRIVGLTRGASEALGADRPVIGERLDTVFDLSLDDLPDLMRGRPTEERLVHLRDGRRMFGHAIAPNTPRAPVRRSAARPGGAFAGLSGGDPALDLTLERAERLAGGGIPLMITGETGTGKERLARAIHVAGPPGRSFVPLRAAGLSARRLAEAVAAVEGPATVFLRGIADLSDEAQAALLAVLDSRDDLRTIVSSRGDHAGRVRADLLYRLAAATLALPALRLRRDVDWLIDRLARRIGGEVRLSPAARAELAGRDWPGNIHELQGALATAVALSEGPVIDLPDLPAPATGTPVAPHEPDLETVLEACGWNMARAARRLGVNRSTIMRRVRRAGLVPPC